MLIDHLFIFSKNRGSEADELLDFGLTEGSSRIHPGQGTTNRKFYFENFFLEILWVHDEEEIRNGKASAIGLWERSRFSESHRSRFGLCLENDNSTDELFLEAGSYQPEYFPTGQSIRYLDFPSMPWTFGLPFSPSNQKPNEPMDHRAGINVLSKAIFGLPPSQYDGLGMELGAQISLVSSDRPQLTLVFDNERQGKDKHFPDLDLSIRY